MPTLSTLGAKFRPSNQMTGSTTVAADVLAIPVSHACVVKTTGADAEALTLADGVPGQILTIILGTDGGGDGTLTPTTATGFTTIGFNEANDSATLRFIDSSVGWVLIGATDTLSVAGGQMTGSTTVAADDLVIPVTHASVVKTTGADAEALTLANGTPGQELMITLGTDGGGDGTLTPTTATGFTTIVFADAGDTVSLKFIDATTGWTIAGSTGLTAQPAVAIT